MIDTRQARFMASDSLSRLCVAGNARRVTRQTTLGIKHMQTTQQHHTVYIKVPPMLHLPSILCCLWYTNTSVYFHKYNICDKNLPLSLRIHVFVAMNPTIPTMQRNKSCDLEEQCGTVSVRTFTIKTTLFYGT